MKLKILMYYKILLIIILFFLLLVNSNQVYSITQIPEKKEMINEIKEQVASKASQLRNTEEDFIISGLIKNRQKDYIEIITDNGEKTIYHDNMTKYYWIKSDGNRLNINYTNIEENDFFSVLVKQEIDKIVAKIFVGMEQSIGLIGKVTDIDKINKQIKFSLKQNNDNLKLDFTNNTKIFTVTKNKELAEKHFEDIKVGAKIYQRGRYDINDKSKIHTERIVIF